MLFFRGGTQVARGHYWAPTNGSWIDGRSEHLLPGSQHTIYVRIHPVAMFLLAPVIGLAFVVTLPMIAVAAVVTAAVTRIAREVAQSVSALAYFEWRPNEAYLAGKRRKDPKQDSGDEGSH